MAGRPCEPGSHRAWPTGWRSATAHEAGSRGPTVFGDIRSSTSISASVNASLGLARGSARLSIVSQKLRQLRMQKIAIRLVNRSAVRSCESSALQPDFRILWKVSIFQRIAYQSIFSTASALERTGRLVMSFHCRGARPEGASRSCACSTVSSSGGYCLCLPMGGSTQI